MQCDEAGLFAIDAIMRIAHTLRRDARQRELTAPECAVLANDQRLRDAGWTWGPHGPHHPDQPRRT